MNLTDMRLKVRQDLRDTDPVNQRLADAEIDRHIAHALQDFSVALPLEQVAEIATIAGDRAVSVAALTDRVSVAAVEYPLGQVPPVYQRFAIWLDTLTFLGPDVPDGSDCRVYYAALHTLDESGSTLPARFEDLVATGAAGYAAAALAGYSIDRINDGGIDTPRFWQEWSEAKLGFFREKLKQFGRNNTVRVGQLYTPAYPIVSQSTDPGP